MGRFRRWLIWKLGGFTTDINVYIVAQSAVSAYIESQEENRRLKLRNSELVEQLEELKK